MTGSDDTVVITHRFYCEGDPKPQYRVTGCEKVLAEAVKMAIKRQVPVFVDVFRKKASRWEGVARVVTQPRSPSLTDALALAGERGHAVHIDMAKTPRGDWTSVVRIVIEARSGIAKAI